MKWIKEIERHYQEALQLYNENQIVGIFLQGSQNYGLEIETSDVDTKCILTPTFKEIVMGKPMISTTHILKNNEHLDAKDIRSYISCFKKQNLNFLEILFTDYYIINPLYKAEWNRLVAAREEIAHMNPWRAVKSMKGVALEKYHAMEHEYPSKVEVLAKFGYDPKQLHHLARVDNYETRYIAGESYESCLKPELNLKKFLLDLKRGAWDLEAARELAKLCLDHVTKIADEFCNSTEDKENEETRALLEEVCYNIMEISMKKELMEE